MFLFNSLLPSLHQNPPGSDRRLGVVHISSGAGRLSPALCIMKVIGREEPQTPPTYFILGGVEVEVEAGSSHLSP